jgi:Co/Zn/Cd efflux system component
LNFGLIVNINRSGPFDEKTDSKKSGRYHKNQKEKEKSDIESGSDSLSSLDSDLDAKPSPNIRGDHSENSIQMSTLSNVSNPTMNDDIEHTLENTQEERDDNDDNDNDDDDDDNDDDDDGDGNGDDNQTKGQKKKRKTSKNLRALFLHLLGDALGSLGTCLI